MKLLKFPSDAKLRKKFFSPADVGHPARANLWMIIWLVKKLTKPGDTILDPMSGAGTIIYATLLGRNVLCMELEKHLVDIQHLSWTYLKTYHNPTGKCVIVPAGDARRYLPITPPTNHIIFSPPYSHLLGRPGPKLAALAIESGASVMDYGKDVAQIGHLSYFNYLIAMKEIYKGCYQSLADDGYMALITKDFVDSRKGDAFGMGGVIPLSADTIKICYEVGFELYQLWQRDAPPSLQLRIAWQQNPNIPKITTEEISIFTKRR